MMNILILVLSYNEPPYSDLMKAQQDTWDSIEVEGVDTLYYYGGAIGRHYFKMVRYGRYGSSEEVQLPCGDKYFYMSEKLKLTLELVKDWDYQFIFRTNSSSYCHKQRLKKFAETLPTKNLYAGWSYIDSEDFSGVSISGAGIWLSRDTAEILRNDIEPDKELEEDVYCGRLLRKHGIEAIDDKSRFDVGEYIDDTIPNDRYHYRLKNNDRYNDAQNFYKLHEIVK